MKQSLFAQKKSPERLFLYIKLKIQLQIAGLDPAHFTHKLAEEEGNHRRKDYTKENQSYPEHYRGGIALGYHTQGAYQTAGTHTAVNTGVCKLEAKGRCIGLEGSGILFSANNILSTRSMLANPLGML